MGRNEFIIFKTEGTEAPEDFKSLEWQQQREGIHACSRKAALFLNAATAVRASGKGGSHSSSGKEHQGPQAARTNEQSAWEEQVNTHMLVSAE
eukprot:1142194-Pelagomonas_calceolata.AAC.8